MSVKLTITPLTTSISATSSVTELTISSAIPGSVNDADSVSYTDAPGQLAGITTVGDALDHLANQFYTQTTAPTAGSTGLAEGDLFYDTDDNQLKIYREVSSGTFQFVPIMIGNNSSDSDTIDAGSF